MTSSHRNPEQRSSINSFMDGNLGYVHNLIGARKFVTDVHVNSPVQDIVDSICRSYLIQLKTWGSQLDSLSTAKQEAIWDLCKQLPSFAGFVNDRFDYSITSWERDFNSSKHYIVGLYSAVSFLRRFDLLPEISDKPDSYRDGLDFQRPESSNNLKRKQPGTYYPSNSSTTSQNKSRTANYNPTDTKTYPNSKAPTKHNNNTLPNITSRLPTSQIGRSPIPPKVSQSPREEVAPGGSQLTQCGVCRQWLRYPDGAQVIRCPKCNNIIYQDVARSSSSLAPQIKHNNNNIYTQPHRPSSSPQRQRSPTRSTSQPIHNNVQMSSHNYLPPPPVVPSPLINTPNWHSYSATSSPSFPLNPGALVIPQYPNREQYRRLRMDDSPNIPPLRPNIPNKFTSDSSSKLGLHFGFNKEELPSPKTPGSGAVFIDISSDNDTPPSNPSAPQSV